MEEFSPRAELEHPRYSLVWYGMVWYGTQFGTVPFGMVLYGMVGYSASVFVASHTAADDLPRFCLRCSFPPTAPSAS